MHDLSDWNVLVIDDEPDNVGVIELVLSFHSAIVRTASSGMECLKMLGEEIPTLLLVDIQMPHMSGLELLAKIREHENWHHIPIVAVTAHAMMGDSERFALAGFDGYIPKPINAMSLVDELLPIVTTKVKAS
ncbi:MAG: response regulator [Anaerolineae bacterium]|nr:response regulator [Anaerolineae bacterium]